MQSRGPALMTLAMRKAWQDDPRFPEALEASYQYACFGDFEVWTRRP